MHFLSVWFFCLVLFFFSLGWGGGSVCWCSEYIYIYIYFIFLFLFGRLFPEQLGFSSSCSSFLSRASPRSVCVSIAGDGRGPSQLLELWFRMPCLFLGLFLAPDLYLPKSSSLFPLVHAGHVLWSQRRRVSVRVCVCVCLEVCFGSRGRTRRGVLHFSKDFLRDFGCGSPLPPPFICQMDPFLLF